MELVEEKSRADEFENAIRRFGVEAACEWFGYAKDDAFTIETKRILDERLKPKEASDE